MKVIRPYPSLRATAAAALALGFSLSAAGLFLSRPASLRAQEQKISWSAQEKPIADQIGGLRSLPDNVRGQATNKLALEIRQLPVTPNKLRLANSLAMLSTEGDFGHEMLQEVATTLTAALHEQPLPAKNGRPPQPYVELAELVRYEHVQATLDDPQFAAAVAKLEADNERRQQADFTLAELGGKTWTLKEQRGKVVVLNFWATWCPPCVEELPSLMSMQERTKARGVVVLGVSIDVDEDAYHRFLKLHNVNLLTIRDPEQKVAGMYGTAGWPETYIIDRQGIVRRKVVGPIDWTSPDVMEFLSKL